MYKNLFFFAGKYPSIYNWWQST